MTVERRLWFALLLAIVTATSGGCITYGSFQSARIIDPGRPHLTISLSRNDFLEDDQIVSGWTLAEFHGRHVLYPEWSEFGVRLSVMHPDDGGAGFVLGGNIKSRIWCDHLALDLPLSVLVGDFDFNTLQFHPSLIGSVRLHRTLEINVHAKTFLFREIPGKPINSYGVGLALGPDLSQWAIRPEASWLHETDSDETYLQLGIGLEVPFGGGKPEEED